MDEQNDKLSPKELYDQKKLGKEQDQSKAGVVRSGKKAIKTIAYIFIAVAILGGVIWLFSRVPNLPPTTDQGHVEDSPASHIGTILIPDVVQRHMLEHADGGGRPGIIIQYNCEDYACESGLLEKLTSIVEDFPANVYLAPNNYDGKIILTAIDRREILDEFDDQIIRAFINN